MALKAKNKRLFGEDGCACTRVRVGAGAYRMHAAQLSLFPGSFLRYQIRNEDIKTKTGARSCRFLLPWGRMRDNRSLPSTAGMHTPVHPS